MVFLGSEWLHFVYIGVMALISLSIYYLFHVILQFEKIIAIPSAVIPNILPSLMIPLGFNASYAMWALLPFLLSLILLHKSDNITGSRRFTWYILSFIFYYVSLNMSAVGTFLIPCLLAIFIFQTERLKISVVAVKALPFLMYGLFHLYNHSQNTHKTPIRNSLEVIIDRARQLLEMSDFLMFSQQYAIWAILSLMFIGVLGIAICKRIQVDVFVAKVSYTYRIFVLIWLFCWLGANSVAYLVVSPTFRPHDYAYILNFGTVLLQVAGIAFCFLVFKNFVFVRYTRFHPDILLIVTLIIFVGGQRIHGYYNSPEINQIETASYEIRELLLGVDLADMSQVVVLGVKTPHTGVFDVNSGYIRYLTGNHGLNALIGFDRYPLNPFRVKGSWLDPMTGLKQRYPIVIYRKTSNGFKQVNYFLQTIKNSTSSYPRISWRLYDVSSGDKPPLLVKEGGGIDKFGVFIEEYFGGKIPYIAFSPKIKADRIISETEALELLNKEDRLVREVLYRAGFNLLDMQKTFIDDKSYIQILVHFNRQPKAKFRLGYKMYDDKKMYILGSSEFALQDDYLVFYYPDKGFMTDLTEKNVKFFNVGVWPFKVIKKQDNL